MGWGVAAEGIKTAGVLAAIPGSVRERARLLCVTVGSSGRAFGEGDLPYEAIPAPRLISATIVLDAGCVCVFLPIPANILVVPSDPPGD